MSGNGRAIDKRSMRTRNDIARAIIRLGPKRGLDAVTVSELAREAGISRSTFYAHFPSIEEYLAQSFATMIVGMASHGARDHSSPLLPVSLILAHVAGAPDYVAAVSRSRYRPAMFSRGEQRLAGYLEHRLADRRTELGKSERAATARFVSAGFVGMLRDWMETGMRKPAAEFERDFVNLVGRL